MTDLNVSVRVSQGPFSLQSRQLSPLQHFRGIGDLRGINYYLSMSSENDSAMIHWLFPGHRGSHQTTGALRWIQHGLCPCSKGTNGSTFKGQVGGESCAWSHRAVRWVGYLKHGCSMTCSNECEEMWWADVTKSFISHVKEQCRFGSL